VLIDILDDYTNANSRILVQFADTSYGRTGSSFVTKLFNSNLPSHFSGLALSGTQKCIYRYGGSGFVSIGGPIISTAPVSVQYGPDATRLIYSCSPATLQFTGSLEAITPDNPPSSNTSDTIRVQLRENTVPYEPVDVKKVILSNSGNVNIGFTNIRPGRPYYLILMHRSSIETWSSAFVTFPNAGANVSYDFTTGVNKAFGDNLTIAQGTPSFYAGDVNGDYSVDGSDLSQIENDASAFLTGYNKTDINNDDIVDGTDGLFVDNNAANFVIMVRP
jgi:hypothetical protein